jgi:PAS domain S-box-containing protein
MVDQFNKGQRTKQEWIVYASELETQLRQCQTDTMLNAEIEQLAAIVAAQQDIVLLYDPEMNVRRVNPAFQATYGFDPVGINVREIIRRVYCRNLNGQPLDLSQQPTPLALKGRKVSSARLLVKRPDGRDQIVETSASPVMRGQDILGSVTVWHDITELQQIRQTLEKANDTLQEQAEELEIQTEELQQQTDELIAANQMLTESEQKYALLFGKSAVASALTKLPENTFVDVNESFEKLLGYSRDELIGKTALEVGIAKPEEYAVTVATVATKGRHQDAEKHFRTKAGEEIIALVNVDSLEMNGKQYTITTLQDITERKQAEERIQRQNAILTGINQIFQKAITCQTEEELGRVCLVVAEGVTASQIGFIGEINLQSGKLDELAISDPGWEVCRIQGQIKAGKRIPIGFIIHGVYGRVLTDGQSLFTNDLPSHPDAIGLPPGHSPIQAFLGVPLFSNGKLIGMVGLGNRVGGYRSDDVKAVEALAPAIVQALFSKRAEGELRKSQEKERLRAAQLEAVMQALPIGMAILDEKGGELQTNQAFEQTWESPRPNVGSIKDYASYKAWFVDTGEELKPEEWASAQAVQKGATVIGQVIEIQRFDGTRGYVLNSASPVKDADAKIIGSAVAIQDITPLHEAEQKLKAANDFLEQRVRERTAELEKALQVERVLRQQLIQSEKYAALARLVGSVAHEINNPLQTVKNCLFLIRNETKPKARADEINMAVSEIRRISDLVQLMRQTYRPSSQQLLDFDLLDLISKVRALIEPQLRQYDVMWRLEKDQDCIILHGNPDQIQQVCLNICLNALEAMSSSGGTLAVSLKLPGDRSQVEMTFHDTGPGIPKADLERIFEPFFTTKEKGTGLGLAICYDIVNNHKGKITVESEPGVGATFKIWLPL